jgi:protein gp37
MNKTKIEWCDSTWNPVTGCLHDCEYCYARKIANRFGGHMDHDYKGEDKKIHELKEALVFYNPEARKAPYPFDFEPTFHKYRLDEPARKTKGQNIFVCSMADLFGDWVPGEWIRKVFAACEKAPQHNYLFLTKNPERYKEFEYLCCSNMWFGISYTHLTGSTVPGYGIIPGAKEFLEINNQNLFMSLEPILEPLHLGIMRHYVKWIIVGAETGNGKGKVIPEKSWIDNLVEECKFRNIPVFMKDSLITIMGEENMLREFPVELMR